MGVGPEGIGEAVLGGVGGILNVLQEAPSIGSYVTPIDDTNQDSN